MLPNAIWTLIAGLSGFIAVAMGAVGAHLVTDAAHGALIEKASLYQLIHTLALMWLMPTSGGIAAAARLAFLAGILLFCGSLYLKGMGLFAAASLAPMGGMLLMAGWILIGASKMRAVKKVK